MTKKVKKVKKEKKFAIKSIRLPHTELDWAIEEAFLRGFEGNFSQFVRSLIRKERVAQVRNETIEH